VRISVTIRNSQGEEIRVQGVNLSTGGMGLDGVQEPLRFAGLLDLSFVLPESEVLFQAKARLMWIGDEGRVGIRFAVIEPALFEQLQHWTNKKMKEEGWEFPVVFGAVSFYNRCSHYETCQTVSSTVPSTHFTIA